MAAGEALPAGKGVSRRERVELEARSVIRQVGIHIYRVVKSIGVSVSRVSCKETLEGVRCEPIGRRERGTGGGGGWRTGGKGQGRETEALRLRHQTDEDRTQPLFLLPRFPFDPFCCFAIHPLPPHVSSPCILILPIIPTSQFGQPFGCSGYLATPRRPVERAKGNQNKQGKEEPREWVDGGRGGKGISASYRLGFLSELGF